MVQSSGSDSKNLHPQKDQYSEILNHLFYIVHHTVRTYTLVDAPHKEKTRMKAYLQWANLKTVEIATYSFLAVSRLLKYSLRKI